MDLVGCHQPDAGVMMLLVIPCEEATAEGAGLFDGFEVPGKFRLVFQRLEVSLRERIVVRGVRPAVGLEHAEIDQHKGGCPCLHGPSAIGMQR